jgi:thioredoxin 1
MATEIMELSDGDFKSALAENDGIVLFYKKICPHCKALKKVIEKVAANHPDLNVMQIDSEENPTAMAELEIGRVPTLLVNHDGNIIGRKTGLFGARELTALIQTA